MPAALGLGSGCHLLSVTAESVLVVPKKQNMLPYLVVLFLISYGLMALLVVEQGRTIDNQRDLIRNLFSDSSQLNSMKSSALQKHSAAAQAKTPSSQVQPQDNTKSGHVAGKLRKQLPQKPPTAASDTADSRRTVVTI
jgi:hypothetical protein